ncbi:DUF4459 domain-containing protein [Salmonella enterica]|nr:DUF4459 domain-containing protein [Salmonella enterica]
MKKCFLFIFVCLFIFSANAELKFRPEFENKKIYFQGKVTDYTLNDFTFFGDSREPFYGSENDDYTATADEWLGFYAELPDVRKWQRVVPDDFSTMYGAPWCDIQFFEQENDHSVITGSEHMRCIDFLVTPKRKGLIPMGTKGTLMDYGSYLAFAPQIEHITLEGRFPEASRTWLPVRSVQTRATSIADLKIMLNEIYARHGYIFRPGGEMDRYFRQQPWYRPRYANVDYLITKTEYRNIKLLKELLSPESQRKKALYIQNTTDFCEALKANNIKYVMDNTAEYLTTGADQPINLEKVWQKYRDLMINGGGNCQRDIESYKRYSFLYSEPLGIYYNSTFEFDEKKGKYVLTYVNFDSSCNKEGDTIELEGMMVKREHVIEDNQGQHSDKDLELKTINLQCVAGAMMDQPDWDRYVQLILPPEKYNYYQRFIGERITLRGKVMIAESMYHVTPVLLNLLEEQNPIIKVADMPARP